MRLKIIVATICLLFPTHSLGANSEQKFSRELTLWLIPFWGIEKDPSEDKARLDEWDDNFSRDDSMVSCLNTKDPFLRSQLSLRNPELGEPSWGLVSEQRSFLESLKRFAYTNNVKLKVRFIMWPKLFKTLKAAIENKEAPDIALIGSTWVKYFSDRQWLYSSDNMDNTLEWRNHSGKNIASMPFTIDIRILFYWKQLPDSSTFDKPLKINSENWESIIDSLKQSEIRVPMVFPIQLNPNLIHDLAPMIADSGFELIEKGIGGIGVKASLNKDKLKIPILLAENHRIFAFPEMTHEEARRNFIDGKYIATIEPADFIVWWHFYFKDKKKKSGISGDFWDYAGIMIPPATFKGGSDLVILKTKHPELAFLMLAFIAKDTMLRTIVASSGMILAQANDYGLDMMLAGIEGASEKYAPIVREALNTGQEYQPLAEWPDQIETRDVYESLQLLWRRIGEGNEDGKAKERVMSAASEVEKTINGKIYWWTKMWNFITQGAVLGIGFIGMLWFIIQSGISNNERKKKVIALTLARSKFHYLLNSVSARVVDFADMIDPKRKSISIKDLENAINIIEEYGDVVGDYFSNHYRVVDAIIREIEHRYRPLTFIEEDKQQLTLKKIVEEAFESAKRVCLIKQGHVIGMGRCIDDELELWELRKFPFVLMVVLEEWILNCFKEWMKILHRHPHKIGVINVYIEDKQLHIISPTPINKKALNIAIDFKKMEKWGLPIIRDLLKNAFGSEFTLNSLSGSETELIIPLPIHKQKGERT